MARTLQNTRILTENRRGLQNFRGHASAPIFVPLQTVNPGYATGSGYVVVDDTGHPQFDTSMDWPWVVNQSLPEASSASCSAVDVSKVTNSVKIKIFSILLIVSILSVDTVVYPVLLSLTVWEGM